MSIFTRPILEINLDNLTENYLTLQKISGKATAAAVVKDDAYGLGAASLTARPSTAWATKKWRHLARRYKIPATFAAPRP